MSHTSINNTDATTLEKQPNRRTDSVSAEPRFVMRLFGAVQGGLSLAVSLVRPRVGGAESDKLYGEAGSDTLYGNDGPDTIHGGQGDDTIYGGNGDDTIRGNAGADIIYPGSGSNILLGTSSLDEVIVATIGEN